MPPTNLNSQSGPEALPTRPPASGEVQAPIASAPEKAKIAALEQKLGPAEVLVQPEVINVPTPEQATPSELPNNVVPIRPVEAVPPAPVTEIDAIEAAELAKVGEAVQIIDPTRQAGQVLEFGRKVGEDPFSLNNKVTEIREQDDNKLASQSTAGTTEVRADDALAAQGGKVIELQPRTAQPEGQIDDGLKKAA